MTAIRQADGSTLYRGHTITVNGAVRPGRMGRYTVMGREFAQLAPAKAAVDWHETNKSLDAQQ